MTIDSVVNQEYNEVTGKALKITGYLYFDVDGAYIYGNKSGNGKYLWFASTPFEKENLSGKKYSWSLRLSMSIALMIVMYCVVDY